MELASESGRKTFDDRSCLVWLEFDLPCLRLAEEEPVLSILARDNFREGDGFDHAAKCGSAVHARPLAGMPSWPGAVMRSPKVPPLDDEDDW